MVSRIGLCIISHIVSNVGKLSQSQLLSLYSENNKRITFTTTENKLELLQAGDVITIDWPSQHIPRDHYIVFEIRHTLSGLLEIEAGSYRKGLENKLAEMIVQQKKVNAFLRSDRFKAPIVDESVLESFKIKPIKLVVKIISTSGNTQIGLSTPLGVIIPLGIGATTSTEAINEDYT